MAVITISHQIGSGGREIGRAVADKLGLDYVDKEVVQGVARQLGISEQTASSMDEKAQGTLMRVLSRLNVGTSMLIVPPTPEETAPNEQDYFDATRKTIAAAAQSNHAVIAGHGANFALLGTPGIFNVYIHAPRTTRIATIMARDGINKDAATQQVAQNDQDRGHYIKTFYNAHWRDADFYHLAIDTGLIPQAQAVDLIVAALRDTQHG